MYTYRVYLLSTWTITFSSCNHRSVAWGNSSMVSEDPPDMCSYTQELLLLLLSLRDIVGLLIPSKSKTHIISYHIISNFSNPHDFNT